MNFQLICCNNWDSATTMWRQGGKWVKIIPILIQTSKILKVSIGLRGILTIIKLLLIDRIESFVSTLLKLLHSGLCIFNSPSRSVQWSGKFNISLSFIPFQERALSWIYRDYLPVAKCKLSLKCDPYSIWSVWIFFGLESRQRANIVD